MRREMASAAVLLASAIAAMGCAAVTRSEMSGAEEYGAHSPITVQVTSDHLQDVDVFVADGGLRYRMGMLSTGQTAKFTLPNVPSLIGRVLQVLVHPIGGGDDYRTESFIVTPGDEVDLSIRATLPQTSFSIRQRPSPIQVRSSTSH